jgi:UDP-N-acetylmuramyl pentapeptide phosphotransferase/UDP-N-acetylglucosamine-1-phosphate transferase
VPTIAIALFGAVLTLAAALAYVRLWRRAFGPQRTPTGFGALLAPVLLTMAYTIGTPLDLTLALAVGAAGAGIYWLDDAYEISARVRVAVAAATGLGIGWLLAHQVGLGLGWTLGLTGLAAFAHVALVNTINMQDGADLNLATLTALTGALTLFFAEGSTFWMSAGWSCLAFAAGFAAINRTPRSLYFGDSGCFALSVPFTLMGVAFLVGREPPPLEAVMALGLPIVDMAFVTAHRVRIRQKFTVRHYFHLYQRLQTTRPGFGYLAPQIATVALALAASAGLQELGVERVWAVGVATAGAGLLIFWAGHRFFVRGEPGPPPQWSAA